MELYYRMGAMGASTGVCVYRWGLSTADFFIPGGLEKWWDLLCVRDSSAMEQTSLLVLKELERALNDS